jgi:lipoprotein-anchoring transpeptidase ErfK/SrfK
MVAVHRWCRFVSAALAFALVLGMMPALAVGDATSNTVTVNVHVTDTDPPLNLNGMTADEASAAIVSACATPTLAPLAAVAAGTTSTLDVTDAVTLDVSGMVTAAVDATAETTITPVWDPDPAAIAAFVDGIASTVNHPAVNATRKMVGRRFTVTSQIDGVTVDKTGAASAISNAITAEIAAGGSAQPTVTIPVTTVAASVTTANIGKTIVVVLGTRYLYLYNGAKLQKKYRCAVGQPRYPTPRGIWKVVKKVKNPVWHNPWDPWSMGMPAVIRYGRNNPLGTRAMYLSAPGIRIHGVPASENSSIGHAASHGCIRLKNSNAVQLYPLVPVGTPVYIVK